MQEAIITENAITPVVAAASSRIAAKNLQLARRALALVVLLLDGTLVWLAFCTAYYLRYIARWMPTEHATVHVPLADWLPFGAFFTALVVLSLASSGLYKARLGRDLFDETSHILRAATIAVGLLVIVSTFLPIIEYSRLVILYSWFMVILYLAIGRGILYALLARLRRQEWNVRRVVVAGTTPLSRMVLQRLIARRGNGYQLLGFVHESAGPASMPLRRDFGRFKCLGGVGDIQQVIDNWNVDEIIVALPASAHADIAALCAHCEQAGVVVKLVPDLFELSLSRVRMDHLAGIPLIDVRQPSRRTAARVLKRVLDICIAGLVLTLAAPLMLLTALAIKLDSPGPVLANQRRVGKDGKHFTFFKFRSMKVGADGERETLAARHGITEVRIFKDRHDPRRTRVGRLIRRLSIDELPQLINVLRGDMSIVGPRPPLPAEVARYEPHHFKRLQVAGGITGLWQVSGRSDIESFEEIVLMDRFYIDNWSLALDLRILVNTVAAVVARTGAY